MRLESVDMQDQSAKWALRTEENKQETQIFGTSPSQAGKKICKRCRAYRARMTCAGKLSERRFLQKHL